MTSLLPLLTGCERKEPAARDSKVETPPPSTPNLEQPQTPGRHATSVNAHKSRINAILITPDGKILASASYDNTVKLWSLPDGKFLQSLDGHQGSVHSLAVTPDGKLIASGSDDYTVKLWSLPDRKLLQTFGFQAIGAMAVTLDGKALASGSDDGTVKLLSLPDGKLLQTLGGHRGNVHSLAIAPDGKLLASASSDNTVKLWSLPDGKLLQSLDGHQGSVDSLAIAPDGKLIASGSYDRTVKLWSLPDGKLLHTLVGHPDWVKNLAITPDGKLLASTSFGQTVKLWSLPDGKLLQTLGGHRGPVRSLAIAPDSSLLASSDSSGVIILWELPIGRLRSYLFDPKASQTDAFVYHVTDPKTGGIVTYTLPCGSPVPTGATCVCNCVPGTYSPPASSGGGSMCTCNKICTCIPVCQAHRVLHPDAFVRGLAEQLLLIMGGHESAYLRWAADQAAPSLKSRIEQITNAILNGAQPAPASWPTVAQCAPYLDDTDEIVAIMAAQMIAQQNSRAPSPLDSHQKMRVEHLLADAQARPWFVRAGLTRPQ